MLGVTVICVGRLRESYLRQACAEYQKRLSRFCNLTVCELSPAPLPEEPGEAQIRKALQQEEKAILQAVPKGAVTVALCIEGEQLSSQQLAQHLSRIQAESARLCLCIGGSHGLSEGLKKSCDLCLSFSKMTFPHQLFRVLLLEQLYRAFTIIGHQKYHK